MATGRPAGRPAKPVERHRAAGNPSKKQLPGAPAPGQGLPSSGTVPPPPAGLLKQGKALWERLWTHSRTWLAPGVDDTLVEMLCRNADEIHKLTLTLKKGRWYTTPAGQLVTHPAFTQRKDLLEKQTAWLAALGQSPADRARLGLAEVRVKDELDELQAKRDRRAEAARTGS